jgi:hypothetical protein
MVNGAENLVSVREETQEKTEVAANLQENSTDPIPTLSREEQPSYSSLANLEDHIGELIEVTAYGEQSFHGVNRGVIRISTGVFFKAGIDLESKANLLRPGTKVKILKKRTDPKTRKTYALVGIVDPGDWSFGDYNSLPFINKAKNLEVIGVKDVMVKGEKRKIAMADNGIVYRCKRSKLEDMLRPGLTLK